MVEELQGEECCSSHANTGLEKGAFVRPSMEWLAPRAYLP